MQSLNHVSRLFYPNTLHVSPFGGTRYARSLILPRRTDSTSYVGHVVQYSTIDTPVVIYIPPIVISRGGFHGGFRLLAITFGLVYVNCKILAASERFPDVKSSP